MAGSREQDYLLSGQFKYPIVVHGRAKVEKDDLLRVEVLPHYEPAIHCAEGGDIEDDADELEFREREPAVNTSAEFFSKDLGSSLVRFKCGCCP
uniref:Uncharacterized protein n=1 Tax=Tetranychus urticae TaxID=32264 RepID=T1JQ12_TETUR